MKKVFLGEASNKQIVHYFANNPEKFEVPENYNEVCNDVRYYRITRYCDVIDIKVYDFLYTELFRIKADYDMVIEADGPCLWEETPADGVGLF